MSDTQPRVLENIVADEALFERLRLTRQGVLPINLTHEEFTGSIGHLTEWLGERNRTPRLEVVVKIKQGLFAYYSSGNAVIDVDVYGFSSQRRRSIDSMPGMYVDETSYSFLGFLLFALFNPFRIGDIWEKYMGNIEKVNKSKSNMEIFKSQNIKNTLLKTLHVELTPESFDSYKSRQSQQNLQAQRIGNGEILAPDRVALQILAYQLGANAVVEYNSHYKENGFVSGIPVRLARLQSSEPQPLFDVGNVVPLRPLSVGSRTNYRKS